MDDLNPTPEARVAMSIWKHEYAYGRLGSMGFWNSIGKSRQGICRTVLADIAKAAIKHGRTLEDMANADAVTR